MMQFHQTLDLQYSLATYTYIHYHCQHYEFQDCKPTVVVNKIQDLCECGVLGGSAANQMKSECMHLAHFVLVLYHHART